MTDQAPRITTALAHWDKTIADTGGVFWANVLPSVALSLQRVLLAAGHLADAVEAELPAIRATIEAMAPVVVAARVLMLGETNEGAWVPFAQAWRELETAVLAYDALTASTPDAAKGEG